MRTGIYRIRNKLNGKCYIGSAAYLRDGFSGRWSTHRHHLRRGSHHSTHLQSSWSKHGEDNFTFEILLYCTPEDCLIYEQIALDCYKPEYNTCAVAGSPLGYRHTEKAKRAIAKASKGRKLSSKGRLMVSLAQRGENSSCAKLTEQDVLFIRAGLEEGQTQKSMVERFGVSYTTIHDIKNRKTWKHI